MLTFSPFSIIVIIVGLVLFLVSSNKKLFLLRFSLYGFVIFELFCDVGYFVIIGESLRIRNSEFYLVLLFFSSLIQTDKNVSRRLTYIIAFLFVSILTSYLSLLLFAHYEISAISSSDAVNWDSYIYGTTNLVNIAIRNESLFKIAKLLIASFSALFITASSNCKKEINRIKVLLPKWYRLLYVYLFIEAIFVYFFKSNALRDVVLFIFSRGYNIATYNSYTGRLYGLFTEPSTVSFTLFVNALVLIAREKRCFNAKEAVFGGFCIITIMFLSLSFSALWYLAILYLLILITLFKKKGHRLLKILLAGVPCLALVLVGTTNGQYFATRLESTFVVLKNLDNPSNLSKTSEAIRIYSIYYLFNMFLRHPIFGVGFDVTYCFSGSVTSLATIGLVGTALLIWFLVTFYQSFNRKFSKIACGIFLICYLFTGQIGSLMPYYASTFIVFSSLQVIFANETILLSERYRRYLLIVLNKSASILQI